MTPYYQDDAVTLYHGDCREVELPTPDLLLTDPPYGINVQTNYGSRKRGALARSNDYGEGIVGDAEPFDRVCPTRPMRVGLLKASERDQSRMHPTQKPLALMQTIIGWLTKPGDLILDPYAGSGTTLLAARAMDRRSIGVEVEERYCELIANRLAQGDLFGGAA